MEILNAGGNAIDAAVAAAATLGVTDPFSCGIGGGGFMLIWSAKDKRVIALDHREVAPASFHPGVFLDAEGKAMDWKATVPNGIAVGVPGTVRGWHEALTRYGTMDFDKVLAPAIRIADQGFAVGPNFHRINKVNEAKFARFSTASALYLKDGQALPVGTTSATRTWRRPTATSRAAASRPSMKGRSRPASCRRSITRQSARRHRHRGRHDDGRPQGLRGAAAPAGTLDLPRL
jgi:gamma-glutamyltransferase 1 (EC:2.3.2.2). Threonine peptidase. MEROPS family T03